MAEEYSPKAARGDVFLPFVRDLDETLSEEVGCILSCAEEFERYYTWYDEGFLGVPCCDAVHSAYGLVSISLIIYVEKHHAH